MRHAALIEFVYAVRPVWVRVTGFLDLDDQRRPLEGLDEFLRSDVGQNQPRAACARVAAEEQRRSELIPLLQELTPTSRSAPGRLVAGDDRCGRPSAEISWRFADFHGRMLRLQAVLEEEVSGHLTRVQYEIGDEK